LLSALTPGPSPTGEGRKKISSRLPLPLGEGWGEGFIKKIRTTVQFSDVSQMDIWSIGCTVRGRRCFPDPYDGKKGAGSARLLCLSLKP
jgi:hypothetical protein